MFKKILVTVDGSDVSRRGLFQAIALAADQQATLYVLNVVDGMPASWSHYVDEQFRPTRMELLLQGLRTSGQRVLEEAQADCPQTRTAGRNPAGRCAWARVRGSRPRGSPTCRGRSRGAGTHGRDGVARLLGGSKAESLLRRADVPVLVVREPGVVKDNRASSVRSVPRLAWVQPLKAGPLLPADEA